MLHKNHPEGGFLKIDADHLGYFMEEGFKLLDTGCASLGGDIFTVGFYGLVADVQDSGNIFGALIVDGELEHLQLPFAELLHEIGVALHQLLQLNQLLAWDELQQHIAIIGVAGETAESCLDVIEYLLLLVTESLLVYPDNARINAYRFAVFPTHQIIYDTHLSRHSYGRLSRQYSSMHNCMTACGNLSDQRNCMRNARCLLLRKHVAE